MTDLGILTKEKKGNLSLFRTCKNCPYLKELTGLYLKTEGFLESIKKALENKKNIRYSFVFGSTAKEKINEKSDIDLMIIGDLDETEIIGEILNIQKKIKREINFIVWDNNDFRKKIEENSRFLENISKSRIWIRGDENEFIRIIKKGYNRKDRKK
jgi:predicted nucleotidyltransferase